MGIVSDALSYVGLITYDFGANDIPGGRGDCSAFTQYIYGQYGYRIGRDTRAQLAWCRKNAQEVKYSEIQPGDIVFFQNTYPGRVGVSHVGIATGGEMMVNLQNDGLLHEKIWKNSFMTAYRFADQEDVKAPGSDIVEEDQGEGSGWLDKWGVKWWGDILVVVLILGCIAFGLFFVYKAFASQVPSVKGVAADALKTISKGDAE